ncbi:hypothetical protein EVAR_17303_1 [Eumeta japonica]|uniref:Uncharacterized protein n=1 Tax=Eumeta variegata TaxID=151549 RepID=A0A4C1TTF6_EUMVA|nr:hypothetical protein EVAR_17303_1 [Eumeta japonica]
MDLLGVTGYILTREHSLTSHSRSQLTSRQRALVARKRRFVAPCTIKRRFAHRAGVNMDWDRKNERILAWLMEKDLEDIEDPTFRANYTKGDRGSEHSHHFTDTEQSSSEVEESELPGEGKPNGICAICPRRKNRKIKKSDMCKARIFDEE